MNWGKSFLAITDQAGQQLVPMKGQLSGTFLQEVVGLLHGAQVSADGYLHHVGKAQGPHGGFQLGGRGVLAVLAHKGGGHAGDDLSPRFMAWISWKIWLLSAMAAKGQFTRHIPQETHLS